MNDLWIDGYYNIWIICKSNSNPKGLKTTKYIFMSYIYFYFCFVLLQEFRVATLLVH